MKSKMFRDKVRYYFDGLYSMGSRVMLPGLLIVIMLYVIIVSGFLWALNATGDLGFLGIAMRSLARIIDPGDLEADGIGLIGLAMLSMRIFGLIILGTLVGIINQAMTSRMENIRKGRSKVVEKNHVIILGWSELIFQIIEELIKGREDNARLVVAIMANKDKVEMEETIKQRIKVRKWLRIVCRTGNLLQPLDLKLMNIPLARSVIVLPYSRDDGDMACIKTLLAMKNNLNSCPPNLSMVSAFARSYNIRLAQIIYPRIKCIDLGDVIGKIIAHTSLQPGLSLVYKELLNFEGSEFYYSDKFQDLAGKSFGTMLSYFENSSLVGILTKDKSTLLNPDMERIYEAGEELLFIAEKQSSIALRPGIDDRTDWQAIRKLHTELKPRPILILGWNWRSKWLLKELNIFLPDNASVTVYTDPEPDVSSEIKRVDEKYRHLSIEHKIADITSREVLESIDFEAYGHVILLSCCNLPTRTHTDARILATILHLQDIMATRGCNCNMIIELEDDRNRSLISAYNIDDIVISDFYSALIISQISQNPHLLNMYKELFSTDGSEIYLKPMPDYVSIEAPVEFYTLVESARARSELAIGYKIHNNGEETPGSLNIVLNPNKSEKIQFGPSDRLIVIAEDY